MRPRAASTGLVLLTLVAAGWVSDVSPGAMFDSEGAASAWELLGGLASPDLSRDFVGRIARLSLETVLIGMLGTALAVVLGTSLALIGTRVPGLPDPPRGSRLVGAVAAAIRLAVRFLLGLFRSIPDLVWAFLFVRLLGLGPGPAVLAIAISAGGIIGKLFAELAEAADPGPIHALRRTGSGRLGVLVYGVLPQVHKQWIAYALFRLECSIRSASILGVVGAGGLGTEIALSVRYLEYEKLATALIAVLVLVVAVESASSFLRRRRLRWTLAAAGLGALAAFLALDIPWAEMLRSSLIPEGVSVEVDGMAELVRRTLPLVGETIAMAWCATIVAAAIAFLVAPLAARTLGTGSYLVDPPPQRGASRWLVIASRAASRFLFQVFRATPELTLALMFVVWVGPGPFAGVLAVAVHTVGVLGRLYTDVYEEVERPPVAALEATGASRFAIWLYGVVPQITPRILAFTLYRFEVNVRNTTMVGVVGAGGIGASIDTAISLFHVTDLVWQLAVIVAVVTALDWAGDRLRFRILIARFGARAPRSRPSRLSNYRVAPSAAQQGDDHGRQETRTEESSAGDPDRRAAVVRLLGAGEDQPAGAERSWRGGDR